MSDRQTQRAGDGSQQIQIAGNLVIGITEERAAEIAESKIRHVIAEFSEEARDTIYERVSKFDKQLISEVASQQDLSVFADPSFQFLLQKAQLHAACTGDDGDYHLLAKLLGERARKPTRPIQMIVSHAVEVVDEIDPPALDGLTALWIFQYVNTASDDPVAGLGAIDELLSKVQFAHLSGNFSWLSRLDVLGCIRFNSSGMVFLKKWRQLITDRYPGYFGPGFSMQQYDDIVSRVREIEPRLVTLVAKDKISSNRCRIAASSMDTLFAKIAAFGIPLSEKQITSLRELMAGLRVFEFDAERYAAVENFINTQLPSLARIRTWWDQIPGSASMTPLGMAIAYANVKRFDALYGIPELSQLLDDAAF